MAQPLLTCSGKNRRPLPPSVCRNAASPLSRVISWKRSGGSARRAVEDEGRPPHPASSARDRAATTGAEHRLTPNTRSLAAAAPPSLLQTLARGGQLRVPVERQ